MSGKELKRLCVSQTDRSMEEAIHHPISNMSVNAAAFVPSILHQQQIHKQNNYSQIMKHQSPNRGQFGNCDLRQWSARSWLNNATGQSAVLYLKNRYSQQINQHPNLNHHEQQQQQHYNFNKYYQDNRGYKQHNNQRFYNCDHQTQQQQQLRHHPGMHHTINVESNSSEYANDMENIALDYLQSVIQSLNKNSGRFDTIATRFFSVFEGMENNTFVLSNAIEEVFNESMKNPNFRYMGAKIYNLLHKLNPRKDSLFYTLLRYKLDFHQNELKENINMNQQSKVRETALFLAELYMQLREEELRIQFIAEKIICSLKQLLSKENVDNVRCICMTLKLAGYDLTTDCPEGIEEIITDLNAIDDRSPEKYPLVSIVVSLQKNNWGRKVCRPESPIEINKDIDSIRCSDDPVFYGPDGSIITDEECDFLTISANNISDSTDNVDIDNDSEVDLDPEMDEETESAYKEFIKQNAKSS